MAILGSISSFDKRRLRPSITRITTNTGQIFDEVRRNDGECAYERVFVGKGPPPQYLEESSHGFSELDCQFFDKGSEKWASISRRAPASLAHSKSDVLKLVSYNVWFSEKNWKNRAHTLLDIVEEQSADIICFQEVTQDFLDELLLSKWVRASYSVTDARGTTVFPYGVLMLVRSAVAITRARLHTLPSNMGRRFLLCELIWCGLPLAVGTVHLESMDNASVREAQLCRIFDVSASIPRLILAGDFNFHAGMPENRLVLAFAADSWAAAGAASSCRQGALIDRVVHRSLVSDLAPASARLLGTDPVVPPPTDRAAAGTTASSLQPLASAAAVSVAMGGDWSSRWACPEELYPSDHDGVAIEFRLQQPPPEPTAPHGGAPARGAPAMV